MRKERDILERRRPYPERAGGSGDRDLGGSLRWLAVALLLVAGACTEEPASSAVPRRDPMTTEAPEDVIRDAAHPAEVLRTFPQVNGDEAGACERTFDWWLSSPIAG